MSLEGREQSRTSSAEDSPTRLTEVAGGSSVLFWSTDAQLRCDWTSASWSRFTGCEASDLEGNGWMAFVHPEDIERCIGIRQASAAAKQPFDMDWRLRRHDGVYRWVMDHGQPRRGPNGGLLGYIGTCIDIQERKELEERLADRTRSLRLAERRHGAYLDVLAHDLRNPLAPISNAASVLRTIEHTNPILVRLREILDRQVGRLSRLIDDLVEVTRSAHGQISLVNERLSVESIVQAAVGLSHDVVTSGGHVLDVHVPDTQLFVKGDLSRLAQALGNVLTNAAHFSPEPGVITISVRQSGQDARIEVRDKGRGISAAFLPHVFELLAQQDTALSRTLGGLGVGLTIARRIAQLQGGDIEARSDGPGLGSEFVLRLPLAGEPTMLRSAAAPTPALSESYRVLVIEEQVDSSESLRLQMEMWGNEVMTARSLNEAIDAVTGFEPHIVLCDLDVTGQDGLQSLKPLRDKLAGRQVLVAAVTGHARGEDQAEAMQAGFDSLLVKPLLAESLTRLMRSCADRAAVSDPRSLVTES